jgi:hypothetical protein
MVCKDLFAIKLKVPLTTLLVAVNPETAFSALFVALAPMLNNPFILLADIFHAEELTGPLIVNAPGPIF